MSRRTAKRLPPIPEDVFNTFGRIPVVLTPNLKDDAGGDVFGYWDAVNREIRLLAGMAPAQAWLTLWHERTHAELNEIGVELTKDQEEAVVNAIARARVAEMLAASKP